MATYSASHEELATPTCLVEAHDTGTSLMQTTYPLTDRRDVLHVAHSASTHAESTPSPRRSLEKTNGESTVPLR
jgi:hypothetical protein